MATPDTAVQALSDEQIKKLALKYRIELNFVRAAIAADRALRVPAEPFAWFVETHDGGSILFHEHSEAWAACTSGQAPEPLYVTPPAPKKAP